MKNPSFKKRGVSTVVGGLIFLFLMSSGISAFFLAIETQSEMIDVQNKIANTEVKKIQEKFSIAVATDETDNNRLAIHVKNQGNYYVEIDSIWIVNKTDVLNDYPVKRYSIAYDDRFFPPGYGGNILQSQPLYLIPDVYDIKVVSTLGTIKKNELDVNGQNYLKAELFAIPPDVRIGENVTITLHVTNTGDLDLTNVTPSGFPIVEPSFPVVASALVSPSTVNLGPMETAFFTWQYKLAGTVGTKMKFSNNVTGVDDNNLTVKSNTAYDYVTIRQDEGGGGDLIVLKEDLFSKPEIFLIAPAPFGDDNDEGLWGVNVVNPTDQIMNVSKVVISAISPGANNNDELFSLGCPTTNIEPSGTNYWSCIKENQVTWKSLSNPISIPKFSVQPFLVKMEPGSISASMPDLESMLVQATVVTTSGQFGKAGYDSSMRNDEDAIVNVFLSDTPELIGNPNILGAVTGITSNQVVTFNPTIADFDNESTDYIKQGSRLIINVPREWTSVAVLSHNGFNTPTVQTFTDGSTQIVGDLINNLNGVSNLGKTIQFSAVAPNVTSTKMYLMYILADGETGNDFTIGPLSETVLQVCPISGCS